MESDCSSTDSNDLGQKYCCFNEWLDLQHQDLSELLQAQTLNPDNSVLSQLVQKNIQHYQDYAEKRTPLAQADVSDFFAPPWCTSLEKSLLWIAGCRPSIFIRLVYALCGAHFESQLAEFLRGVRTGKLSELSASQLGQVDALQARTVKEEEKLSSRLASLQEAVADEPLAVIAAKETSNEVCESTRDSDEALDDHGKGMAKVVREADRLRLSTLKELMGILTPVQGVEYLVASKKVHLCVREWGRKRDHMHRRN